MKRLFVAFAGMMVLTGAAAAADLSRPPPVYPRAQVFVPPSYDWTGFYFGINGGGGFGSSSWNSTGSRDVSGGVVGSQLGYNRQIGQAVFGVEGDLDWSDINGSSNNLCAAGCKTTNTWLSTVRGRLGYAADRFMPFVTGGVAFGNIEASTPGFPQGGADRTGWTLGGGLEAALVSNWTAKVEYLYVDLGNFNCGLNCGAGLTTDNVSFHANVLRAGLNYRFW
jgi:outer membrane immunogenic protein